MIITDFKRMIRAGFTYFWRNAFVSFSSILVMIITLSFITSLLFGQAALNSTITTLKQKVDMNVYFVTTAEPDDIFALKKTLEKMPEIASVTYVSRDQALEALKARHPDDGTIEAINELGDNPLGALLNIQAKDPSQYEAIARFLKTDDTLSKDGSSIVRKVNFYEHETAINTLSRIINATNRFGFILTIVLAVISIIIAFNTIRLTIYNAREEIAVMKLVGATNKYVRGPFVVSGILCGVLAGIFTIIIFAILVYSIRNYATNFFIGINFFQYFVAHIVKFVGVIIGSGIVIGALSSYLAVRRYLKV